MNRRDALTLFAAGFTAGFSNSALVKSDAPAFENLFYGTYL